MGEFFSICSYNAFSLITTIVESQNHQKFGRAMMSVIHTHTVIHSLRQILAPNCLPLFTSDGLNLYFYALTAHFGQWLEVVQRGRHVRQWQVAAGLIYGQVKKSYRRRKLLRVTPVMRLGTQADLTLALQGMGFSGRLNTAFIERVNLTVRHGVAALARRTWATSQQAPQLLAHLHWWQTYYHFVRPHASLRMALVQPRERGGKLMAQRYRQRTEADGSRENQPTMDGARGALLPIATGSRLKPLNLDAVAVSGRGEVGASASRSSRMGPHSRMRWPVRTAS
jgi:hypothetical protein